MAAVRSEDENALTIDRAPLWQPSFPSPELVQHAADLIPHIAERRHEREVDRHRKYVDIAATWEGDMRDPLPTRGAITAWTRRSRARLVERLSDLDYTKLYGRFRVCGACREEFDDQLAYCPACRSARSTIEDRRSRLPAMLTLTYPGDWLTVAPTADAAMGHFQALCKRYARVWGEPLRGPWKKEFQGRGAVHFHISTTPPMGTTTVTDPETGAPLVVDFRRWLSITWVDIVGHPDPEQRRRHLAAGRALTTPRA